MYGGGSSGALARGPLEVWTGVRHRVPRRLLAADDLRVSRLRSSRSTRGLLQRRLGEPRSLRVRRLSPLRERRGHHGRGARQPPVARRVAPVAARALRCGHGGSTCARARPRCPHVCALLSLPARDSRGAAARWSDRRTCPHLPLGGLDPVVGHRKPQHRCPVLRIPRGLPRAEGSRARGQTANGCTHRGSRALCAERAHVRGRGRGAPAPGRVVSPARASRHGAPLVGDPRRCRGGGTRIHGGDHGQGGGGYLRARRRSIFLLPSCGSDLLAVVRPTGDDEHAPPGRRGRARRQHRGLRRLAMAHDARAPTPLLACVCRRLRPGGRLCVPHHARREPGSDQGRDVQSRQHLRRLRHGRRAVRNGDGALVPACKPTKTGRRGGRRMRLARGCWLHRPRLRTTSTRGSGRHNCRSPSWR